MRPSPTAGQASLEYIAVIALVAALLLAAPAVGAPSLAGQVAKGIRLGLCTVAGDVCTNRQAQAEGLPPCTMSADAKGLETGVTLFSIDFGARHELTGYRASDGTINLSWSEGVDAGVGVGLGPELPGIEVGLDGDAKLKAGGALGWTFHDEATARRFVAGLPASAAEPSKWPPAWELGQGGIEGAAHIGAALGIDLAKFDLDGDRVAAIRHSSDGTWTLLMSMSTEGPEGRVPYFSHVGLGKSTVLAEYTLDGLGLKTLALHITSPHQRGKQADEIVARLDLRDPANEPLRHLSWRTPVDEDHVLRLAARNGTIEHYTYAVNDTTRSLHASIALGIKWGGSVKWWDVKKNLVDATVTEPAGKPRSRFDCLDQLG